MNGFQKTSILKVCQRKWSKSGRSLSEEVKIKKWEAWKTKVRFGNSERGWERWRVWCVRLIWSLFLREKKCASDEVGNFHGLTQ